MINTHSETKTIAKLARELAVVIGIAIVVSSPHAQSFSSGSDGSDGSLAIAANQGTILFDPTDTARWGRILDGDGDGVYNFSTVTIGSGSTLKLQGDKVNRPVFWLVSGNVVIDGTIDLNGAGGDRPNDLSLRRQVSVPGSGGYAGGAGGLLNTAVPATPGEGPGGGGGHVLPNGNGLVCGTGGTFSGNRYLIPLIGGSGGGGALDNAGLYEGGGAGGGAILIASSTSISISGTVRAQGGGGAAWNIASGAGSGGAIRLVAPTIAGGGQLDVRGGSSSWGGCVGPGTNGWVRLEGFTISTQLNFAAGGAFVLRGSPVDATSLRPVSSLRVIAIDGITIAPTPSGSFVLPDVSINKRTPVNVDIEAHGIPSGTVVTLQVLSQTPSDMNTLNVTAQATLTGTLQSSTASATFTFPYGFSRGYLRASWTQ